MESPTFTDGPGSPRVSESASPGRSPRGCGAGLCSRLPHRVGPGAVSSQSRPDTVTQPRSLHKFVEQILGVFPCTEQSMRWVTAFHDGVWCEEIIEPNGVLPREIQADGGSRGVSHGQQK